MAKSNIKHFKVMLKQAAPPYSKYIAESLPTQKSKKSIKSRILGSLCLPRGSEVWQMCRTPLSFFSLIPPPLCWSHSCVLPLPPTWKASAAFASIDIDTFSTTTSGWQPVFMLSSFIAVSPYPRKLNIEDKL